MTTNRELLEWAESELKEAGLEQPRFEAELLLAEAMQINRLETILKLKEKAGAETQRKFRQYVHKRKKHFPFSYIVKNAYFYGLKFFIDKGVLIPRPETELLVEEVVKAVDSRKLIVDRKRIRMLEIGVGSGAVAVALAKNIPQAVVYGTEIAGKALTIARKNIALHRVKQSVVLKKGNLFSSFREKFDIIVANPPYLSDKDFRNLQPEVAYEPKSALYGGKDGLDYYRKIVSQLKQYLNPRGFIAFEMGYGQAEKINDLLLKEKIFSNIDVKKDYCGIERIIIGTREGFRG